MQTITIADLIAGNYEPACLVDHLIYRVREAETIFYVGLSRAGVIDRALSHLGMGPFGEVSEPSELDRFIMSQSPDSEQWVFDFLTLSDCEAITGYFYQACRSVGAAEQDLIEMYKPYFNRKHNPSGGKLPARYMPAAMGTDRKEERRPPGVYSFDLAQLSKVQRGNGNGHARAKRK